jgi:pyrroloquinoline quinone biosynthesis protein E
MEEVPDFIDLALELDAERLEIANVQYAGWALLNRNALMPDREAVEREVEIVRQAQEELHGILAIDFVTPDYFAIYPKPCMGGWARNAFVVAPDGSVLPCHAAGTIPNLSFDRFGEKSLADIWHGSSAFNAFRGTDWMDSICRGCERREIDWGGCRCQAMAIAGNAAATDPACTKSPHHARMAALIEEAMASDKDVFRYRRIGAIAEGQAAGAANKEAAPL